MKKKKIVLTVTSDPYFDQRMIRICTSLHNAGYDVLLLGINRNKEIKDRALPFQYKRMPVLVYSGFAFYLFYNLQLLIRLIFTKADALCAIDLDTILPVYGASILKRIPRVYDAHELFCEIEEISSRPKVQKVWNAIEHFTVPKFPVGYTVNESYVNEYHKLYGVHYSVVRNATVLKPLESKTTLEKYILYQGAVNMGRCFDELIQAIQWVDMKLIICGKGNYFEAAQQLTVDLKLTDKIKFEGYIFPDQLRNYTINAFIGITLFVASSKSNVLSLANRFFDYMHSAVPQLGVAYPEYIAVNNKFEIAYLLDEITPQSVSAALNKMIADQEYYNKLKNNCIAAREQFCWQEEEKRLIAVYQKIFETKS